MQNVVWTEDDVPVMLFLPNDEIQVLDWPQQHALAEGDQVQYFVTEPNQVFVYRVRDVIPELDNDSELNCVTLVKVC